MSVNIETGQHPFTSHSLYPTFHTDRTVKFPSFFWNLTIVSSRCSLSNLNLVEYFLTLLSSSGHGQHSSVGNSLFWVSTLRFRVLPSAHEHKDPSKSAAGMLRPGFAVGSAVYIRVLEPNAQLCSLMFPRGWVLHSVLDNSYPPDTSPPVEIVNRWPHYVSGSLLCTC